MSIDAAIGRFDRILRGVAQVRNRAPRPLPEEAGDGANASSAAAAGELSADERRHAAGLMRVNHAGEVSAQALYLGQAIGARTTAVRDLLDGAADEEFDHLVWCRRRLTELDDRPSRLDPLWFAGSFAIGLAAGALGDRTSLGFLAETERQVVAHLDDHLATLPRADGRSRAILEAMRDDEAHHAHTATVHGGSELPAFVKRGMRLVSQVMKRTAYRV